MEENIKRLKETELKYTEESLRYMEREFSSLIIATSEVIYQMSPDWSEMLQLNSQGFLSNTEKPNSSWLHDYIPPEASKTSNGCDQ